MKRVLLVCLALLSGVKASWADVTANVTATVGVPIIITPPDYAGIAYTDMVGMVGDNWNMKADNHVISDNAAFAVTPTLYSFLDNRLPPEEHSYYSYLLEPLKEGTFTFSQRVGYYFWDQGVRVYSTMTINIIINVVEVKAVTIANSLSLPMGSTKAITATIAPSTATTNLTGAAAIQRSYRWITAI